MRFRGGEKIDRHYRPTTLGLFSVHFRPIYMTKLLIFLHLVNMYLYFDTKYLFRAMVFESWDFFFGTVAFTAIDDGSFFFCPSVKVKAAEISPKSLKSLH